MFVHLKSVLYGKAYVLVPFNHNVAVKSPTQGQKESDIPKPTKAGF